MAITTFNLTRSFDVDAIKISAACEAAALLHSNIDIDSAGDEVEHVIRRVLAAHLPKEVHVGQGHVVDENLATSGQMDIVLADQVSPHLFEAEDGTHYYPYEGIFWLGEIKKKYWKKKEQIQSFCDKLSDLRNGLVRKDAPKSYMGGGVFLEGVKNDVAWPIRNPLLRFMVFCESGDFKPEDLDGLFELYESAVFPNFVCFLDKGLIMAYMGRPQKDGIEPLGIILVPEFVGKEGYSVENPTDVALYGLFDFNEGVHKGRNLTALVVAMVEHLQRVRLLPPNLTAYLQKAMELPRQHMSVGYVGGKPNS
jgi:hypothetical protein